MDFNTVMTLLGFGVAAAGLITSLIMRDRAMTKTIADGDAAVTRDLDDQVRQLNARLTALDDRINGVNDRFVRRDDLVQHIERIERAIETGQSEQRETNKRIDILIASLAGRTVAQVP